MIWPPAKSRVMPVIGLSYAPSMHSQEMEVRLRADQLPGSPGLRKARHEADPVAVLNNGARRQLSSPRTARSLRAKASGWPAYPDSPPRKPPWLLGNTAGCCPSSSAVATDVRPVKVPTDS